MAEEMLGAKEHRLDRGGRWKVKWPKEAELRGEKHGEDEFSNFLETSFCFRDSLHFLSTLGHVCDCEIKREQVGVCRRCTVANQVTSCAGVR